MTLAVASALGAAAPLALGRLDAGRVVAEPLRELGLRSGRRQAVGPALLLERREVREGVEARAEALALRRRRAGLLGTSALDVDLSSARVSVTSRARGGGYPGEFLGLLMRPLRFPGRHRVAPRRVIRN